MSDIFDGVDPILIAKKWLKDAEKTEITKTAYKQLECSVITC